MASHEWRDSFLESREWRTVRMRALEKHGAKCQCCGRTADHGIVINVDHIKPRATHPELALTESNLQILCNECNHGKGNWSERDWRPKRIAPPTMEEWINGLEGDLAAGMVSRLKDPDVMRFASKRWPHPETDAFARYVAAMGQRA